MSIADQQEATDLTLHGLDLGGSYCIIAGGRDAFLISSNSSVNENPPHLKLPVYSSGHLVSNSLPNLPLVSFKKRICPLFPGFVPAFLS